MDFQSAEQERERLLAQLTAGQISADGYNAAVNALRVTDARGGWWQPDPHGKGWLAWNGTAWQPGTPPGAPGTAGPQTGTPKNFVEFQSRLMTIDEWKKMSKEVPLAKRPQKWWDLLSILGGCASAGLWLLYSGIREGFDFLTPVLMIGIPVLMIWFRSDLDVALLPVQPYRRDVNKILLIGVGMAFPFLSAFILFNIGIREYPLMQWNMIIGTIGAYIITRTPVISLPGTGGHGRGSKPLSPVTHGILVLLAAAIGSILAVPVRADDCSRDFLNLNDCMRTDGPAEVIAGGFSALVSTSVNGPAVVQTVGGDGGGGAQSAPASPASQPSAPAGQAGSSSPSAGGSQAAQTTQASSAGTPSGGAGQAAGAASTGQPAVPTDTAGQAGGISSTGGIPPVSSSGHAGAAGQGAGGVSQAAATSSAPTSLPGGHGAGSAAQSAAGSTPATSTGTTTASTVSGQAGSGTQAATAAQGPDSLPFSPDDVQNIKEAIEDTRRERDLVAAATAATAAAVEAGAAAVTPPGIDPATGKRILTPEQQARREQILREMEQNSKEAAEWSTYADRLGYAETGLSVVEKGADIAIDVGATLSPGAGSRIKTIYAATKTIAKDMSESYATDKGLLAGFERGAVEAATDKALDLFAGQVTDKFAGKIPGFGKFEAPPGTDLGSMSLSQIRDRVGGALIRPDTGDAIQDLRQIAIQTINTGEAREAMTNAAKNALQGQAQSAVLWDPFKKFFGISS